MKKICYFLNRPTNEGSENLIAVSASYSEANLEIVKREAYNGEYTVEDDEVL